MLQTFVITLREGVEAALVIAIAVAYLKKTGRFELIGTVYRAFITAVFACFVAAWGFTKINLSADSYEGYTLLLSAVFVFSMVVWMNSHGRRLKGEIESRLQEGTPDGRGNWGVFLFVFLMIFREGLETLLLLWTVRLDTSGVLQWVSAAAGIALAALFGISFVRGTVRVNLRQFFQMTTVILMVVVAQLTITGLHELSEARILPSSKTEMAIIGPVVKNDIFFFITILALAAVMMLMEWRKRRSPKTDGLEGVALRKAKWTARRERLWMTASCIASCVFILMITAEFIYARQAAALSEAASVTFENHAIRLPTAALSDGQLHRFIVDDQGVHVRFIVIQKPDRSLAVALDACAICGTQGFYQKGSEVICKNCASNIVTATIGTPGGCNPIPLKSHIEGGTLVIDEAALDGGVSTFRKG
ncbi:MAG: high-affinity iron transporter [Bryobacterales bacterium]|jgi:FTR1 family protein|nr:high-affinity iron transporter [Bryobacterales bacterium]